MIRLIYEVKEMMDKENLSEEYKEVYDVLSKMIYSRELDEKSNELNKEINEYLQGEKENK